MVCVRQITAKYVLAEDVLLLKQQQKRLRKALIGEELPVLIDYAGLPVRIRNIDNSALLMYLQAYHVHMRLKLMSIMEGLPTGRVEQVACILAISERVLTEFLQGFMPLTLLELHRVNNFIGWHIWEVKFVPTAERKQGDTDFKDPDLFI